MVVIEAVMYPYIFTKCGKRIGIKEIKGNPVVGATLENTFGNWSVVGVSESNCEV
jgi:hypothetical protein